MSERSDASARRAMSRYREPWDTDTDLAGGAKSDRTDTVTRILDANGAELVYGIESHDPRVSDEEYADRIRDCVNALEGIEDPVQWVALAKLIITKEQPA